MYYIIETLFEYDTGRFDNVEMPVAQFELMEEATEFICSQKNYEMFEIVTDLKPIMTALNYALNRE